MKVRVDRAGAAGMRDFVTGPYSHPFLMGHAAVHAPVVRLRK